MSARIYDDDGLDLTVPLVEVLGTEWLSGRMIVHLPGLGLADLPVGYTTVQFERQGLDFYGTRWHA